MLRKVLVGMFASALVISSFSIAQAAVTSGSKCRTLNQKEVIKSRVFICVKSGSKLVWQESPAKKLSSVKKTQANQSPSKNESTQVAPSSSQTTQPSNNKIEEVAVKSKVSITTNFISKKREQWHSELQYDGILQLNALLEGNPFAMVGCATFVYDWGTAKNIAGMLREQDSNIVELRIDTQNPNTLPRSVTFIDCPSDTQEPSEKNVPKVSFQFDWKINQGNVSVATKVLSSVIDVTAVKNTIPNFTEFSKGTIRWAQTQSAPVFSLGEKTGVSVVSFYVDYPFDICDGVFTDGSGKSVPAEMTLDRLNGYGSARFKSPVKQTIGYKITCTKSGETSGTIEHTGWLEGRIKVAR